MGLLAFTVGEGEEALQSPEWQSATKTIGVESIGTCSQKGNSISGLILAVKPEQDPRM